MFVFWYCHKRGRETRLAKASTAVEGESKDVDGANDEDDDDDIEDEYSDEDAAEKDASADEIAGGVAKDLLETLEQPNPADIPLPEGSKGKEAV